MPANEIPGLLLTLNIGVQSASSHNRQSSGTLFSSCIRSSFSSSQELRQTSMTFPSKKSLLVYCLFILLPNRTIIATTNIRKRIRDCEDRRVEEGTDLRPQASDVVKSMALTKNGPSSDCFLWNGEPGKCFPVDACLLWSRDVTSSREVGHEIRWPVCEWLHQPVLHHRRHPEVLVTQRQRPLVVCCQEPNLLVGKTHVRDIIRSFVEIPERMAVVNQRESQCGLSFPSIDSHFHLSKRRRRMVSGHWTTAHDFPWMASLFFDGQFRCGASILSDRLLITTAHCLKWKRSVSHVMEVMVGSTDLGSGTVYQVLKVLKHPEYKKLPYTKDLGLVVTVQSIVFNHEVHPICLPPSSMDTKAVQGLMATMTGFGTYYDGKCRLRTCSLAQVRKTCVR